MVCRQDAGYLFTVAIQIFNLPYRRFEIGKAPVTPRSLDFADDPQVTNLRYSRLQVCATSVGNTVNSYCPKDQPQQVRMPQSRRMIPKRVASPCRCGWCSAHNRGPFPRAFGGGIKVCPPEAQRTIALAIVIGKILIVILILSGNRKDGL